MGSAVVSIEQNSSGRTRQIAGNCAILFLIGDSACKTAVPATGIKGAVTLGAPAATPPLRVVIRAGSDDPIDETRSLFQIGAVVAVNGLTAAFVHASLEATPLLCGYDHTRWHCGDRKIRRRG
jgi:hypothetical protein